MGGNPAEAHRAASEWVIEAKKQRKAKLVVVDLRLTAPRRWRTTMRRSVRV